MGHYLMKIRNFFGDLETVTVSVIEADSEQYAKYAYHYIQREAGGHNVAWESGKHFLDMGGNHCTDLDAVYEIDREEYEVMRNHVGTWSNPRK